jgi:hypothetical protein
VGHIGTDGVVCQWKLLRMSYEAFSCKIVPGLSRRYLKVDWYGCEIILLCGTWAFAWDFVLRPTALRLQQLERPHPRRAGIFKCMAVVGEVSYHTNERPLHPRHLAHTRCVCTITDLSKSKIQVDVNSLLDSIRFPKSTLITRSICNTKPNSRSIRTIVCSCIKHTR